MTTGRISSSSSHPKPESRPRGPGLRRADSLPAQRPSDPSPRAKVAPIRHPITRPAPDSKPPAHFQSNGRIIEGSLRKTRALKDGSDGYDQLGKIIERDAEFMDILKTRHPDFERFSTADKERTIPLLTSHPRFAAGMAQVRNAVNAIPSRPTATRTMKPEEQKFLTEAHRRLSEAFQDKPFHIHGETAIVGNKLGEITQFNYSPSLQSHAFINRGDKYHLHTHPPFGEPFTSSASEQDHRIAAEMYRFKNSRVSTYVTNGKDVLHIQPDSTELVKLLPDPAMEERFGKFPVAFTVPDPRQPPYPLSNHEAPL